MADLWLPGFERKLLKAGGTYDDTSNPKLGWHTWEGMSWTAAEAAFKRYPPHIACKPPLPGVKDAGKRQYVPLNRHAYAFAGSESDDEFVIQVEVAGRASETHGWSDEVCEWLAHEIVGPIAEATGVPPVVVPAGFHGPDTYKPRKAGNYLASAKSEIRLSASELRAFSGHLGHQHMPPPDHHWDPGRFPIDRILAQLTNDPIDEEDTVQQIVFYKPDPTDKASNHAYLVTNNVGKWLPTAEAINLCTVLGIRRANQPASPLDKTWRDTAILVDGPLRNVDGGGA